MSKRLDDIAARVEAATPGEWKLDGRTAWAPTEAGTQNRFWATVQGVYPVHVKREELDANAALIANAPADLRHLLAIARAAERLLANIKPHQLWGEDSVAEYERLRAALESKEDVP